ncbi:MAG: hypothetical protein QOE54_949 [Streptosporangiaceae bacterium]|jgi:hypothetical protein|nr:hypothetical protein [Streptosporangiaceae bacterium]MDX6428583.1 hypothetical protein [Streptosporangiaceae bacterium]
MSPTVSPQLAEQAAAGEIDDQAFLGAGHAGMR